MSTSTAQTTQTPDTEVIEHAFRAVAKKHGVRRADKHESWKEAFYWAVGEKVGYETIQEVVQEALVEERRRHSADGIARDGEDVMHALAYALEERGEERDLRAAEWLRENADDDALWDYVGKLLDLFTRFADEQLDGLPVFPGLEQTPAGRVS